MKKFQETKYRLLYIIIKNLIGVEFEYKSRIFYYLSIRTMILIKATCLSVILSLILYTFIRIFDYDYKFNESFALYFYSSLIQSNSALLSIFLIVLIFRIQYLNNKIDLLKEKLIEHYNDSIPKIHLFDEMDLTEKNEHLKDFSIKDDFYTRLFNWYILETQIEISKTSILTVFFFGLLITSLFLINLIIGHNIFSTISLQFLIVLFSLFIEIILFYHLFISIRDSLKNAIPIHSKK